MCSIYRWTPFGSDSPTSRLVYGSSNLLKAIYYEPADATTAKMKSWGFVAMHDYTKDINNIQKLRAMSAVDVPELGTYMARFELHLSSKDAGGSSMAKLPKGFTVTQVIADYLREIGASVMPNLRNKFSDDITMADVQWCVSVPSVWDDHAKKQMQVCMAWAGLLRSVHSAEGSPHPVSIVLEPDAALYYCNRTNPDLELKVGDQLLLADLSEGRTEIVVQEWISETPDNFKVKMVTCRTDVVCGGSILDEQFNKFLVSKIHHLRQSRWKVEATKSEIVKESWEKVKDALDHQLHSGGNYEIQLLSALEADLKGNCNPLSFSYKQLKLTHADVEAIFDPAVENFLTFIADQISRTSNLKVIYVLSGYFTGSQYLLTMIKERFIMGPVKVIYLDSANGSAISKGAVMMARDQVS